MADDLECDICCEVYDEENHRPKNLPCGHTFCSYCMAREINDAKRTCATCRKPHNARSVSDLPTSVTLERLIRNKQGNKRKRTEPGASEDEEDNENVGRCSTHNKSLLYFYCETHSKKVCRECTVIDHRIDRCKVISFKQMFERQRNLGISKAEKNTRFINNMMQSIRNSIKYHKEIESKQRMNIKHYQKEIDIATVKCTQAIEDQTNAKKCMDEEESFREFNEKVKLKVKNATTKTDMDIAIEEIENVYTELQTWTKNKKHTWKKYGECSSSAYDSSIYSVLSVRRLSSDSDD